MAATALRSVCAVVVVAACLAAASPTRGGILFGPLPHPSNGHHYYLLEPSTWTDSQSQAVLLGGHLATIDDAAENQWILQTVASSGSAVSTLWIGLTDRDQEGTWTWVSGATSPYRNFRAGEPNGDVGNWSGCDYASMYIGGPYAGQWNDTSDTNSTDGAPDLTLAHGLVEVPEPASLSLLAGGTAAVLIRRRRRHA